MRRYANTALNRPLGSETVNQGRPRNRVLSSIVRCIEETGDANPKPACKPLLPNEPRVLDWDSEDRLTERFLLPALDHLEALFLRIRATLDPILCDTLPETSAKPYPLGRCLEISKAVGQHLEQLDASALIGGPAAGYAALAAFLAHGGTMRQVWGDLRGQYFQNAFLAGTLYIDVSNDTVVRTKPKVEIQPLRQARFNPIADFHQFARIAGDYWGAHMFPNHLLPKLAPFFPLIALIPGAGVRLESASNYMTALTLTHAFRPSESALEARPMPRDIIQMLSGCFKDSTVEAASDPIQGRDLALKSCAEYRARDWHLCNEKRTIAVKTLFAANQCLARLKVEAKAA